MLTERNLVVKKIIIFLSVILILLFIIGLYKNKTSNTDPIVQIESYQNQYWDTIKKHNVLIQLGEFDSSAKQDLNNLKRLYGKVEDKINKDSDFYKELNNLKKGYDKDIEKAQTQMEMNMLSGEYLENTDKILNEVYQQISITVEAGDFEKIKASEIKWVKELNSYQKYIEQQDFGSIGGLIFAKTSQDIRHFRTLLLIYYLEQMS